jgi:DNA-directed RNA polymerase subunit RPC12/RpoP
MYRYDRVHGLKQMNLFINRLLSLIKLLFHDIISIIMKYRCIVCKKEFVDGHTICHDCWSEHKLDASQWNWCPRNQNFICHTSITPEMVIQQLPL